MVSYRPIQPHECGALVDLHHRCFDSAEIRGTIFFSPRVVNYLQQITRFAKHQQEYFLMGAWHDQRLIGYCWGRALENSWHLNYFAVAPEERKAGTGRNLYLHWLDSGRQRGYQKYSLDVNSTNGQAQAWYERLGWHTNSMSYCYEQPLQPASDGLDVRLQLRGWESAEAWQNRYGFSTFEITDSKKHWTIGRLADDYFRASEELPEDVQSLLCRIDATRRLFLLLPEPITNWTPIKVACRMHLLAEKDLPS